MELQALDTLQSLQIVDPSGTLVNAKDVVLLSWTSYGCSTLSMVGTISASTWA